LTDSRALELVEKVLSNDALFKLAARELESLSPDLRAAEVLIEAFRGGRAQPWLTAYLLGCIGHEAGYAVVREILLAAPRSLAESYAGVALAKIRGAGAFEDLAALLTEAPQRVSREGAAYGLRELGGPAAMAAVAAAGRDRHIKLDVAASILAASVTAELVLELLDSGGERGLAIVAVIIESRLTTTETVEPWNPSESPGIVVAVRGSLERHGHGLSQLRRRHLDQWLEQHERKLVLANSEGQ